MYDFVSESFNRTNSYKNKLSIQVSLNGFSFCIQNEEENRILLFKRADFVISGEHLLARRFRDWYNEEELLRLPFKKREVVLNSPHFSLVPHQLESISLKKTISDLLPGDKDAEYAEGWIKTIQAKLIYHLPSEWAKTTNETLGDSRLVHPVQKLIGYQKRSTEADLLLLYFDEKEMYLVLKKGDELVLTNFFRINHVNDALYFVLTALQQFDLVSKRMTVQTCGKASYLDELVSLFRKYFNRTEILLPTFLEKCELSNEILNQHLCLF